MCGKLTIYRYVESGAYIESQRKPELDKGKMGRGKRNEKLYRKSECKEHGHRGRWSERG